jgi:hypothetical protein
MVLAQQMNVQQATVMMGAPTQKNLAELMGQLGHKTFAVHGEDFGGTYAFFIAGLYPDRVTHLSFCEMMLSEQLTQQSFFARENINAQFN